MILNTLALAVLCVAVLHATNEFGLLPPWSHVAAIALAWLTLPVARAISRAGR